MDFKELLRHHPFLRILLPLIIGILATSKVEMSIEPIHILLFVGLVLILAFVLIPKLRKSVQLKYVYGLLVFFLIVNLGAFRLQTVKNEMRISSPDTSGNYILELLENPIEKTNSYSCAAKICKLLIGDMTMKETANVILYLQKDSLASGLKAGKRILINSQLNKVKNAGNPNEFDYAGYLKTRHILYSSYVKAINWIKIENDGIWNLSALAWKWRDNLLQIYRENGIKDESFDILSALTLGYKTSLDPEIRRAWADAGAMHVLAVSGLHVGIIYLVMSYLLSFLMKIKYGRWIRSIILLIVLWLYALLTGLSPSVLRAVCMFSFIVMGGAMRRKGGVFNSLAASAFFLLLYDPYLLFTVGFQFSYLAVAGIVFFQPRFDRLIYIKNPIVNKFWQLTTVAISAQIATFPLAIYYFNQFPSYFLLSGYVVILMAGILIYLSALLLILSKLEYLSNILGWILQKMVEVLNRIIISIHKLPGAVVHDCSFSFSDVIVFYLIIFTTISILILKRKRAVFTLIILLIVYQVPNVLQINQDENKEIIIFNAGKNSLVALRQGRNVFYLNDEKMDSTKFRFLTNNYNIKNRLYKTHTDTIQEIDFRRFDDKNILIISKNKNNSEELLKTLKPNIILVRKSGLKNYETLTKYSSISTIVADGSVYDKDIKRLRKNTRDNLSNLFVIKDRGAFRINLSSQK